MVDGEKPGALVLLKMHCVCVAKLLSNLSLSVYTSKECCQILTDISLSHIASWEKFKEGEMACFGKSKGDFLLK